MELKLAFLGFGNVGREFARILTSRREILRRDYDLSLQITGIATLRHGCVLSSSGIDLDEARGRVESRESLPGMVSTTAIGDVAEWIDRCDADVLFETSLLSPLDGEPAATYIRRALARGLHVVTANKGPIACAYRELKNLAASRGVKFRFEGTVMDGTPVFNLHEYCLPATQIRGFAGVLNSTTNVILTGMSAGRSFDEGLDEARRAGIAEADADHDIDGWDAAVKAVALANVLMDADLRPRDLQPQGIRHLTREDLAEAARRGKTFRLVARAEAASPTVRIQIAAEEVEINSLFANLDGTSNALTIETDLMGQLSIVEYNPGVTQTAYALLSDLLRVYAEIRMETR